MSSGIEEIQEMISAQCHVCGNQMQFTEGDVIFGEKWYHKNCAKQTMLITSAHNT